MGTTPVLVKPLTQANTTDVAVGAGGNAHQFDGQIVGLMGGGFAMVWTDGSRRRDGAVVTWELQNGQFLGSHSIAFASIGWTIQGGY